MPLLFDKLVKGAVFGCQQCGQCLLSQTAYVCPMTCPKGLRNGPCGGTLDGACEVLPDKPCVWVNIREKEAEDDGLHRPYDPSLLNTSSLNNFILGRDRETRLLKPYADIVPDNSISPSILAQRFHKNELVITYEIASPRQRSGLDRVEKIARQVEKHVDAINTTTNAGGVPSLHSLETARVVASAGVPPIVQFCGRDQDGPEFEKQVQVALQEGFANILVLTGDWNPNVERKLSPKSWFPMDSLQMVDLLVRQKDYIKRPLIGVASNAYTSPIQISLQRFQSKLNAGAHFTQTQIVTETTIFSDWLAQVRATERGRNCKILVSVPLVGKQRPYEILAHLPGVKLGDDFRRSLDGASDLSKVGLKQARELIDKLLQLDVDGIHLMNFGVDIEAVVDLCDEMRSTVRRSAA